MKCNFLTCCSLVFFAFFAAGISGQAKADIVFFTNDNPDTGGPSTGGLLDSGANIFDDLPLTVDVVEIPGLTLTVNSGTSFDSGAEINGSGASFGVNSATPVGGSENASRFDADADESLTISFNQDVSILNADFSSFTGTETFLFGGVTIGAGDVDGSNIFTFADGGLDVPAGTGILLAAGGDPGASVGLISVDIVTTAIPEPTSLAMLGLGSMLMMARRRRS